MMPQSTFMIVAPVAAERVGDLRAILESMNVESGVADPANPVVPFGQFDRLHVARLVIVEAKTSDDLRAHGVAPRPWPPTLVFLGDCDGPYRTFLAELAVRAGPGLRKIFSHCEGFAADERDLLGWMKRRNQRPSANYINWLGRRVVQVHEETALHEALAIELRNIVDKVGSENARQLRQKLLSFVELEKHHGRLKLTPEPPTPWGWRLRNLLHKLGLPLLLLILSPVLVLVAPVVLLRLRMLERSDPEIVQRPDREHVRELAALEDHDFTNAFTAFGDVKPGWFRRTVTFFALWLLNYAARHVYNRGYLTRVQTIHFARWVMIDDNRRLLFASNYDGGLEAYMDDFINKVAWGLNLVFGNGVGYPRTRWIIKGGAEEEQKFKSFLRRRQLPTQVWYKAYPGKTAFDLARDSEIRRGVEIRQQNDDEIRRWLSLI